MFSEYELLEEANRLTRSLRKHGKVPKDSVAKPPNHMEPNPVSNPEEECIAGSKVYGFLIGAMIGVFLQMATLGAFFSLTFGSKEELTHESSTNLILFSCFATPLAAATICYLSTNLVMAALGGIVGGPHTEEQQEELITVVTSVLSNVEASFGNGCLVGIHASWLISFILLDMKKYIGHSFVVALVAFLAWQVVLRVTSPHDNHHITVSAEQKMMQAQRRAVLSSPGDPPGSYPSIEKAVLIDDWEDEP